MKHSNKYALALVAMSAMTARADIVTLDLNFDNYPSDISFQMQQDGVAIPFDPATSSDQGAAGGDGFHGFGSNDPAGQSIVFT